MTKKQRVQVAMLGRVDAFGAANAGKFPEGSAGQEAFANVASALVQVAAAVKEQSLVREGGTALKAAAKEAMLAGITTVVRTARDIAKDTPGADSKFQPPSQLSDVTVLATARQFLDHLPEVKDAFVQHGLPETFIDDLRRTTDGFAQAISGRAAGKTSRSDARADLVAAVRRGMKVVRRLDVIVPNVFGAGSPVVDKWKRERYVAAVGGSSSATEAEAEVMPDAPSASHAADEPLRRAS